MLSQAVFHPIKLAVKDNVKHFQEMVDFADKRAFNLDQIITAQLDEPAKAQRSCVYRVAQDYAKPENELVRIPKITQTKNKFIQIRVKSIDFLETNATAIYLYDTTHEVESLKLESEVLESKSRHASLVNYQMTISHEFKTPLTTSLMFLESLLVENLS